MCVEGVIPVEKNEFVFCECGANVSGEQLVVDLQGWCQRAEGSGIAALQEFARTLRSARA